MQRRVGGNPRKAAHRQHSRHLDAGLDETGFNPREMQMLKVTMENEGGELDSVVVNTGEQAVDALVKMITDAGYLHAGDRFCVREAEA